jgi:DNA-binding response OmpR family regulator
MAERTVLVADDDRSFVEAVALFLEKHGYRMRKAFGGQAALERLNTDHIDVAIIDVHMPDKAGLEIADEIVARPSAPAVILISGDDSPETAEKCRATGAADFMVKPLAPRELLAVIRRSVPARP